ncbi:MAG: lytic transglycosylase domain-containing protein [Syntrophales bacterium]
MINSYFPLPSREGIKVRGLFMAAIFVLLVFATAEASEIYRFHDESGVSFYTNAPGPGRTKVRLPLRAEKRYRAPLSGVTFNYQPETGPYEPLIASASRNYAVDPDVIRAVIKAESNFNELAVSPKGARGLMQLMPATAKELGVADAFDPGQNIHGGARYLSQLLGALDGDLSLALAAYNAGPARVFGKNRIPPIPETRSYVKRVLKLYNNLQGRNTL